MRTCYLHIGHAKTATSSLQSFMHLNDALFEAAGIWVPGDYRAFKSFNCKSIATAGRDFAGNFAPIFNARVAKDAALLERLLDHVFSRDIDVLLSSELVFYYKHFIREVLKAANQRGYAVTLIAYLRRQDRVVVPTYYQNIRNHGYHRTLAAFLEETADVRYFRYQEVMDLYGVAAPNKLVVRTFEPAFLVAGDIIEDFVAVLGAGIPRGAAQRPQAKANQSLQLETLEVLRALNLLGRPDLVAHAIAHADTKQESGSSRAWSYYYDAGIAATMAEQFMAGNKELIAAYLQDRSAAERDYWLQPPDTPQHPPQLDPARTAAVLATLMPAKP